MGKLFIMIIKNNTLSPVACSLSEAKLQTFSLFGVRTKQFICLLL